MSQNTQPRFGKGLAGFGQRGIGQRVLSFAPRLQANAMILGRLMPDTMDLVNNVECGSGTARFTPSCLKVGRPAGTSSQRMGFSGLGQSKAEDAQSIWVLSDTKSDPQMFVTITERYATVGATQAKFLDAVFAKNNPAAMSLTIYKDQIGKQIQQEFPDEPGYAKFTWQKP